MNPQYKYPNEGVSLRCQVYGNPPPSVTWMLAGEPLVTIDRRVRVGAYLYH